MFSNWFCNIKWLENINHKDNKFQLKAQEKCLEVIDFQEENKK